MLCESNKEMCENIPGFWSNMKEELDSTLQVKVCLEVVVPGGWVEVLKTKRVSMIQKKKTVHVNFVSLR